MGIWMVQTWIVLHNKMKEHEEILKKWMQYNIETFEYFRLRKPKYFNHLLEGKRVLVFEVDNLADYEKNRDIWFKDEGFMKIRAEWFSCIETNWQVVFWNEMEI